MLTNFLSFTIMAQNSDLFFRIEEFPSKESAVDDDRLCAK